MEWPSLFGGAPERGFQVNNPPEKLLYSTVEAARALSICPRTLFSMTQPRGPIPAVRLGSRVLYPVAALQSWIDTQAGVAEGRADA